MAICLGAVEFQCLVGLEEMIMRSDLDWPVAGVRDRKRHRPTSFVEDDFTLRGKQLAGLHRRASRIGWWTVTSLVPSGNVASTWISWIISPIPSITWLVSRTP